MIKFTDDEKALIFLSRFEFMTSSKFEQVLSRFYNPRDIFTASPEDLYKLKDILKKNYEVFLDDLVNYSEEEYLTSLEKRGIHVVTIVSKDYPNKLYKLDNRPYVLYYVGNLKLTQEKGVAVVGTRSPSNYGKIVTEKYAKSLAENGICVVSGLATGIDKIAHEGALAVKGKTIAVLGGGFDHIFPAENINLAREIGKNGLILTEYCPKIRPTRYTFPTRNRIIASLADVVLIPEADFGSGSLYTKEYADEIGIDTFCVPGNITSTKSNATNNILKTGNGYVTTSPNDILLHFGISENKKAENKNTLSVSVEQAQIIELLKNGEQNFDYLQEKTNFSTQTLNFNLTTMEISGIIRKLAGNSYILVD